MFGQQKTLPPFALKKITAAFYSMLVLNAVALNAAAETVAESAKGSKPEVIVVTGTKEAQSKRDVAESVAIISEQELAQIAPSHPAEVLNRMPGVYINNLGGEGHMSSIRQPLTTSAVYLFLEDGMPIRPSGFFNHNGLYEINIPQAGRLEVVKGPGSALYGSDAIGGVINVITPAPVAEPLLSANLELGQNGWKRTLLSAGNQINENHNARVDINVTDNQGFLDGADYNRASITSRIDSHLSRQWSAKTVFSYSAVEQSGVSGMVYQDYVDRSTQNRYQGEIGARDVNAMRISSEIAYRPSDDQLLTVTPYFRDNSMTLMPSWMISYDPNIRDYQFQSYGVMAKFRQNHQYGTVIMGIDADVTPSDYLESKIAVSQQDGIYTDHELTGQINYDFSAEQRSISPYIHTDWILAEGWRMTAGIRYDRFVVDYTDNLSGLAIDTAHRRPDSQQRTYQHLSPKWSLLHRLSDDHTAYFNYRHAFVAPSVGSMYRPGSSQQSELLEPTEADSFEIGLRGNIDSNWDYELALYDLQKSNDIVSIINGLDRIVTNAGESRHLGVELGLKGELSETFTASLSLAVTNQYYQNFAYYYQCFSPACGANGQPIKENRNFAGYKVGKAPETLGNISLAYHPSEIKDLRIELEYEHIGQYFTDETNTQSYGGHDLFNLRANYQLSPHLSLNLRAMNLFDRLYSSYTSNQVGNPNLEYRPGLPRTFYLGVTWAL